MVEWERSEIDQAIDTALGKEIPIFLKIETVAKFLKVDMAVVEELCRSKKLTVKKFGRLKRVNLKEVNKLLFKP